MKNISLLNLNWLLCAISLFLPTCSHGASLRYYSDIPQLTSSIYSSNDDIIGVEPVAEPVYTPKLVNTGPSKKALVIGACTVTAVILAVVILKAPKQKSASVSKAAEEATARGISLMNSIYKGMVTADEKTGDETDEMHPIHGVMVTKKAIGTDKYIDIEISGYDFRSSSNEQKDRYKKVELRFGISKTGNTVKLETETKGGDAEFCLGAIDLGTTSVSIGSKPTCTIAKYAQGEIDKKAFTDLKLKEAGEAVSLLQAAFEEVAGVPLDKTSIGEDWKTKPIVYFDLAEYKQHNGEQN